MHLPVSNHGNILPQLLFFFVGVERVDGITVLGKLDYWWETTEYYM